MTWHADFISIYDLTSSCQFSKKHKTYQHILQLHILWIYFFANLLALVSATQSDARVEATEQTVAQESRAFVGIPTSNRRGEFIVCNLVIKQNSCLENC